LHSSSKAVGDLGQGEHIGGTRQNGTSDKLLQHILFCEATLADNFLEDPALKSREIRKQFANNKMERYQYLGAVDASVDGLAKGIEPLGLDFKRYFTIPTELVYLQLQNGIKITPESLFRCNILLERPNSPPS
jgi:hypothetical protein